MTQAGSITKDLEKAPSALTNRLPLWQWLRRAVLIAGISWGLFVLILAAIIEPTPHNNAMFLSIATSGAYTVVLWVTRPLWLPILGLMPRVSAVLLGILNAAIVETIFWFFEMLTGAEGIAAHPNLLIDLLITMPWYIPMVATFVWVQHRRRFSAGTVLLLGGLYELGGDGFVGPFISLFLDGNTQVINPVYWLLLGLIAFWQFILVYSSMLLPSAWLVNKLPPIPKPKLPAWVDAILPLLWLPLFMVYVFVLILILGFLGVA
ncbi:MAG: hypothetical protein DWQ07_20725 [Chloroflexi bacterium]|nr:MAG: hypothetical protein DWQ07_20725 [Chloroflexota bacterium]MBL1194509.1 hypothetical protein [Chloroflexota bacterium]NOH11797.1 hypothetical protein [Chloroflexota bacterium]